MADQFPTFAKTDADARKTLDALTRPAVDRMFRMAQDREMLLTDVRRAKEFLDRADPVSALWMLEVAIRDSEWRHGRYDL